jgi:hypothetical protein
MVGSKWSLQPQSMRKLKPSMETKYDSGFSLYTPHSGVTCTDVPMSLSLSPAKAVGGQAIGRPRFKCYLKAVLCYTVRLVKECKTMFLFVRCRFEFIRA